MCSSSIEYSHPHKLRFKGYARTITFKSHFCKEFEACFESGQFVLRKRSLPAAAALLVPKILFKTGRLKNFIFSVLCLLRFPKNAFKISQGFARVLACMRGWVAAKFQFSRIHFQVTDIFGFWLPKCDIFLGSNLTYFVDIPEFKNQQMLV